MQHTEHASLHNVFSYRPSPNGVVIIINANVNDTKQWRQSRRQQSTAACTRFDVARSFVARFRALCPLKTREFARSWITTGAQPSDIARQAFIGNMRYAAEWAAFHGCFDFIGATRERSDIRRLKVPAQLALFPISRRRLALPDSFLPFFPSLLATVAVSLATRGTLGRNFRAGEARRKHSGRVNAIESSRHKASYRRKCPTDRPLHGARDNSYNYIRAFRPNDCGLFCRWLHARCMFELNTKPPYARARIW